MRVCFFTLLFLMLCPLLSTTASLAHASETEHHYGMKINFLDGKVMKFPDLSIRFTGKRNVQSPVFRPGFTYYDFQVSRGKETKKVSWTSGTGNISPTFFEVGGGRFVLELQSSPAYERFLKEGEMVLWKNDEYEKLRRKVSGGTAP